MGGACARAYCITIVCPDVFAGAVTDAVRHRNPRLNCCDFYYINPGNFRPLFFGGGEINIRGYKLLSFINNADIIIASQKVRQ